MQVRLRFPIFVFLSLLLSTTIARAQTAPITMSETVVVTATGKEEPVSQVGASISVLTTEQIEQRHALSLIDLLRTVPGVAAVRTGGVGSLTSLWTRGGESTYNKVLLDGMPLNEPGGSFNFASLSPENIERIEVLRGAHSALFGSDAMSSVIQIFTKRPATDKPQLNLSVDAGNYSTTHVAAGVGAKARKLEYSLFGSHLETDNREPNNDNQTTTTSGMLSRALQSGGTARFIGRGEWARTGVPGPTAFGRADMDAFFKHSDGDVRAGWTQPLNPHVVQDASYSYTLTHQRSTNLLADPPYTPTFGDLVATYPSSDYLYDSGTELQRHHVDYRVDAVIAANQTLTGAFAYDGERGLLTDYRSTAAPQRPSRNNTGTTVQYEATSSRLSLLGGVRFENNGSFGFYAAPRVSASWLIRPGGHDTGATRLRGSVGLGIKEPTFLQSYSPNPGYQGNPDLKPERSRGFDLAIEQRFAGNRAGIEATYFANHFDDLISLGPYDPVTFNSQYMNIGKTRAAGLELAGDAAANAHVQFHAAYTFLDSKVVQSTSSSPIFAAGQDLYRRPRHSGSGQVAFIRNRLTATLGAVIVGESVDTDFNFPTISKNEGHTAWNAGGEFSFARKATGFITIDNLFNSDYMEPLGYPALGTTFRVGVKATF
jgi:vitamin B12 transporter